MKNKIWLLLLCVMALGSGVVACSGEAVTPSEIVVPFVEVEPENIPKNAKAYAARVMEYGEELGLNENSVLRIGDEQIIDEKPYIMAILVEQEQGHAEVVRERFAFDLKTGDIYLYDVQENSMTLLFNIL